MDITGAIQASGRFPGNSLGSDLAARVLPNPFPLEQADKTGLAGLPAADAGVSGHETFGESLERAIEGIEAKNKEADSTAARYASGEEVELHTVMIAAEQARLSIALAAEVRNKVIEAYQELARTAG
jgi:flagellar hook-basal body complex protein FliE